MIKNRGNANPAMTSVYLPCFYIYSLTADAALSSALFSNFA